MSWKKTLIVIGAFIAVIGGPIYLVSNPMMDTYQEWIDKNPKTDFHKWLELNMVGGFCYKTMRPEKSEIAYRNYLKYYPEDAELRPFVLLRLAESLDEENKNTEAIEVYEQFINEYPNDPAVKDAQDGIKNIKYVKPH